MVSFLGKVWRYLLVGVCLGLGVLWAITAQAGRQSAEQKLSKPAPFVAGELLVRFRSPQAAQQAERQPLAVTLEGRAISVQISDFNGSEVAPGLRLARVAPEDTATALAALAQRDDVLYAEPNYTRQALATPNDPNFAQLWGLNNTGQSGGTAGADIRAVSAWDTTTGSRNVVIGIVDEGIDLNHPDLAANIWHNPGEIANNGLDDDTNGYIDDTNGWDFFHNDRTVYDGSASDLITDEHGTHVAGIAGAVGNNGVGVTGVNWQVSLMSLKILGRENEFPAPASALQTVRAYAYAKQMRDLWQTSGGVRGANIRILNNSYGGPGRSQAELDAITALNASGVLFVVAAGNGGGSNDQLAIYPANYDAPNVISVGASSRSDAFVLFTNSGRRTVHLHAPGAEVLSTTPQGTYSVFTGTSMSAPHVAGSAALLWAAQPDATLARVLGALVYSGDFKNLSNVSGRRLNAQRALSALNENDTTPPAAPGTFRISSQSGRTVDLAWIAPGDDGMSGGLAGAYELRFSANDLSNPLDFARATPLVPPFQSWNPGQAANHTATVPLRARSGFLGLRAIDNTGQAGPVAQVAVSVSLNNAEPYVMLNRPAEPLSSGGTPLNLRGDDEYLLVTLPFDVPLFGFTSDSRIYVSTNGAIYWGATPGLDGDSNDAGSWVMGLQNRFMFAALWDDLRTDRRPGDDVYMLQPDANRVIFRWQGVTFNGPLDNGQGRGENPVNFEIELRRDGTIIKRYGAGNQKVFPVVGVSRGQGGAYLSTTHTSETAITNLNNAPTILYALRNPPAPPVADLGLSMIVNPNPVQTGQNITFSLNLSSSGTALPAEANVTDVLPANLTFVSCTGGAGVTCAHHNGTVTARVTTFFPNQITIVAASSGAPGATISNTATVSSALPDGNPSNNSVTAITGVALGGSLSGARGLAAGRTHSVAVLQNGAVLAWGGNVLGQLGDGTTSDRLAPGPVSGLSGVTAAASSSFSTLALKSDGAVWAWGANQDGQLGDGTQINRPTPVQVSDLTGVTAVASGNFHSVALKTDGTVWGWGQGGLTGDGTLNRRLTPVQVTGLTNVTAISARAGHSLALKADGTIWGWGGNGVGQLGDGTTTFRPAPVRVINLTNVAGIAAGGGDSHSLAVLQDGTVWGWGSNFEYQIAQPVADFSPHPTPLLISGVNGGRPVAGGDHSGLLRPDNTVWMWGSNSSSQLGRLGGGQTPQPLTGLSNVMSLVLGDEHSLALLGDGTVRAWGQNSSGQLGDGTTMDRLVPTPVSGTPVAAAPFLTPAPGTYTTPQDVTLTCPDPETVLRYTFDAVNDPTDSSPVVPCGTTLRVNYTARLRVRAWRPGAFPSGAAGGSYTIGGGNNIDRPEFFVRQHYLDFLGREPDVAGQNYWQNELTRCVLDRNCVHSRRIGISAAFFIEAEFQDTGYFVHRLYRAALGRRPNYAEFNSDRELVLGGANLELLRQAFAQEWTQRRAFLQAYPGSLSNAQFVNQLFDTAGLTGFASERQAEIDAMNTQGRTRAQVLRNVIELPAFRQREYNPAFVLMQYYGYLRREIDQSGYDFWLDVITNREPGNFRGMVCAFLTASEYQLRFGANVTRSNADCSALP